MKDVIWTVPTGMERDMEIYGMHHLKEALFNIKIGGKSVRANPTLRRNLPNECQELFKCIFSQAQSIMVEPMVPGYSGAGIVTVRPFLEHGTGEKVVVKFGDVHQIRLEHDNYTSYVKPFMGGQHNTVILDSCYMANLGGITYNFLSTNIDDMQDFGVFYSSTELTQVKQALDYLFRYACRLWYTNARPLQPLNLTELYQKQPSHSLKKLEAIVSKQMPTVLHQKTLTFGALENISTRNFTNPFYVLRNAQPFVYSSYVTITHGDLHSRNIFLDQNGCTRLIDFESTGPSHILRDVAMLECVIRLQLLSAEDVTLSERLEMEEALCSISRFSELGQLSQGFATTNQALMKAFDAVVHLRSLAQWMVEKKPDDDMSEYFVSLLYNTLETLGFSSLHIEQHQHALLSASLLVDRLGLGDSDR